MQSLADIEHMVYQILSTQQNDKPNDVSLTEIMNISRNHSKNNSLTDRVSALIWADWGFSIVKSMSSGGIPSPIHESKDFQKLIELEDDNKGSSFNSWKIKKIEFSDESITKHKW